MPDVGGPAGWPEWCMGYQPTSPASQPRLRVVCGMRFLAEEFAGIAEDLTGQPMQVWIDNRGRWSVSPAELNVSPKEES